MTESIGQKSVSENIHYNLQSALACQRLLIEKRETIKLYL